MKKLLAIGALSMFTVASLLAQTSSISGTVADPTGAVIPKATVSVLNTQTGAKRSDVSDGQGRYTLSQMTPGIYSLTAQASGFNDVKVERIELLVNTPATINVTFERVGSTSTSVMVEAAAARLNTVDASVGNVITSQEIVELPSFARNVANLLTFQPGVAYFGIPDNPATGVPDDRNGSVNGGRSDQSNITLDGADVNSQSNRAAFTAVLRVTPDSVEEFRTTTSNGGADTGRGSGADITLVTRSGTNNVHGSLYEYRRGTETAANSFFNNRNGVPRAPLLINLFGASVGGPIKRNKAFFFMNYEGRRDASSTSVNRLVPTENLKKGIVTFHDANGALRTIEPDQIKSTVDPLGIGVSAAALAVLQKYPVGNNGSVVGSDGLNFTGYTFNAPIHSKQDTYTAKLDYKLDNSGKESLFWRGNLQNDHAAGIPQFLNAPPNTTQLSNNKGMAAGLTSVLESNLVSSFRYGFTREGGEKSGILSANYVTFRNIDPISGTDTGLARTVPVHSFSEDLAWSHGAHDFRFGGTARLISNQSVNYLKSFSTATTNASVIKGSGNDLVPASINLLKGDTTSYEYGMVAVLGIVTSATANYNNTTDGTIIPQGAPVTRNFVSREGELYAQDSWRIKSNLTLTYGLRFSIMPPVHEANGQQLSSNIPIGQWMDNRGALAAQGLSDQGAGFLSYTPNGRPYYPQHNNWQPRVGIAYSPKGSSAISRFLFGEGKTSIRAGAGMYYDLIGQPLAGFISNNSYGLSTSLATPPNVYTSSQLPRYAGFNQIPSAPNAPLFFQPAPKASFPVSYPDAFAIASSLDDRLKAPYTMNFNFSVARELPHGWFVQGGYVGRLSRHNLVQRDLAMPTNLKDPVSGQTYYQAMTQLATLMDLQHVSIANLPKIPFFENFWAKAGGNGLTPTQVVAQDYFYNANPGDFTSVLSDIDNGQSCNANGLSSFGSTGHVSTVGCSVLGPYSMWSSQYSALNAWSSLGSGAYHSMQWTVSKRMTSGLTMTLNYTLSKSIDIGSRAESNNAYAGDFMINSWNAQQLRGVSRYDALHQANAYLVYQLPFGRGKRFGSSMNRALDAVIGGWEVTSTWRQTSGLPFSVSDGSRWPTNWELSGYATPNGQPIPQIVSSHNAQAVSGAAAPNLWSDPKAALAAFQETMPGQTGSRNALRGDGFFNVDTGLYKNFTMPWSEKQRLQFRWEAYNVTNTVRFDPNSANLSLTSTAKFGQLTGLLGSPRQMEFALRYTF
ncbi:MAG TPA: carboxypeptidase regulatory-like domain-containing protein [Candidatus Acidoferrum sp.]|nr:carboxypeptidase regulatory-like domain-containing protein [Candidatus Acidoferrum sp.]